MRIFFKRKNNRIKTDYTSENTKRLSLEKTKKLLEPIIKIDNL